MQVKYYAGALFSFIIWGCFALVLRPLASYPALDILLSRVSFAAIIIVLVSLTFRYSISKENFFIIRAMSSLDKWKVVGHSIISALTLALNWYLYIYVMNNVSVNATSLAYLICPILTTVLAYFFLKEKLNKGQWLAVGISLLSYLMLGYGNLKDMVFSLIIAFTYALYLILQKKATRLDKFFSLTIHIVLGAIILSPLQSALPSDIVHTHAFYGYIFLIAVLFTIIPLFLNMYALKGLDSSVVGVLLYINPIIAFLLAVFYFKEEINLQQGLAYVLILLAVIVFNMAYLKGRKKIIK